MLCLGDNVLAVPAAEFIQQNRNACGQGRISRQGKRRRPGKFIVQAQPLFRQSLRLAHAGYLCKHLQLLVVRCILVVIVRLGNALYTRPRGGINIPHPAGGVLRARRAGSQLVFAVSPSASAKRQGRFSFLVNGLVKQNQQAVRGLERNPGVFAELGKELNIAGFQLFQPLVKRVRRRLIQALHTVRPRRFAGNAGEAVRLPGAGFPGLPDLGAEREGRGLDCHNGRRAGGVHAVQLEFAAGKYIVLPVAVPVPADDLRVDLQRGRRSGLHRFRQPIFQPEAVPVLNLDLQIVRLSLLVVCTGQGEEIGHDVFRNICTAKDGLHFCTPG